MKKLILMTLVLVLLAIPAMAEEIDLSSLGNDELIQLQNKIVTEINQRGIDTNSLIYEGML